MRIGVVMPAFNVAPYIGCAIRSVLAQTWTDWTLTVVDDGSPDETAAVAAVFDDQRVRLIRQSNEGVSAARNRGVAETRADAMLFLDADDWLSPGALTVLAATLRAHPGAVAAVGPYRRVGSRGRGRVWPPPSGDLLRTLLIRNLFANGGHLLIHRSVLDAAGPFHSGLRFGEDWEFWVRLACLGPFAAAANRAPLLFVRERLGGAYLGMAAQPESFVPCMDAIFGASSVRARFCPGDLAHLRRRTEAENDWIVGRELIRHGRAPEGLPFLRRSVHAAPSIRRLALLAAACVPMTRIGPFRAYAAAGDV